MLCVCVYLLEGVNGCCSTPGCWPEQLQSCWQTWQLAHIVVLCRCTHGKATAGLSIFPSRRHSLHEWGEGSQKEGKSVTIYQSGSHIPRKQGTNSLSWTNKHGWLDCGALPASRGDMCWHYTPKYLHPILFYKGILGRWMDGYRFGGAGWRGQTNGKRSRGIRYTRYNVWMQKWELNLLKTMQPVYKFTAEASHYWCPVREVKPTCTGAMVTP